MQWGIGDAVLALPLLHALREAYPGATIELIGKTFLSSLFFGERSFGTCHALVPPWVAPTRKYAFWERNWRQYWRDLLALRRIKFDLLVSPRCDPRDSVQVRLLRAHRVIGFAAAGGRRWFTTDVGLSLEQIQTLPRIEANAIFARVLLGRDIDPIPDFDRLEAGSEISAEFRQHGRRPGPVLAVSFGAAHPIRRWDSAKISAILDEIQHEIGFLVVILDRGNVGWRLDLPPGVPGMYWESDLAGVKRLMTEVDVLFCSDSGIMHLAAAVKTKVVAIFGPTSPSLFGPSGDRHDVVAIDPMPCRPCYDNCIHDTPVCLDLIGPERVIPVLLNALRSAAQLSAAE